MSTGSVRLPLLFRQSLVLPAGSDAHCDPHGPGEGTLGGCLGGFQRSCPQRPLQGSSYLGRYHRSKKSSCRLKNLLSSLTLYSATCCRYHRICLFESSSCSQLGPDYLTWGDLAWPSLVPRPFAPRPFGKLEREKWPIFRRSVVRRVWGWD